VPSHPRAARVRARAGRRQTGGHRVLSRPDLVAGGGPPSFHDEARGSVSAPGGGEQDAFSPLSERDFERLVRLDDRDDP